MSAEKKKITFETAISRLEKIVHELEREDVSLDNAMKLFQEGKQLSVYCSKKLNEYEKKIKLLIDKGDGDFELKDFEENNASSKNSGSGDLDNAND